MDVEDRTEQADNLLAEALKCLRQGDDNELNDAFSDARKKIYIARQQIFIDKGRYLNPEDNESARVANIIGVALILTFFIMVALYYDPARDFITKLSVFLTEIPKLIVIDISKIFPIQ